MARQTDSPVETFAIGSVKAARTSWPMRRGVRFYRTHHHEQQVAANPLAAYRAQAAIFDEPLRTARLPNYQVCKLARRDVTVALSGMRAMRCSPATGAIGVQDGRAMRGRFHPYPHAAVGAAKAVSESPIGRVMAARQHTFQELALDSAGASTMICCA